MFSYKLLSIYSFSFLFVFCLRATVPTPSIHFTNIDKEKGLSNNNINRIVKDKQGFVWIATSDGLCRYETSNRIKIYRSTPDNPEGLQADNIRTLYADSKDNLWIGTRLGGLTRFHQPTNTWKTFRHNPKDSTSISNDEILSILEDAKGRIWIGTENGLNLFRPKTENFISYHANNKQPNALQAKAILSILEDSKGRIWIGTWGGGLHLLLPNKDGNIANSKFRRFLPANSKETHNIWAIYQDNQNRYWLGTHGGGLMRMKLPLEMSTDINQQDWQPKFQQYIHQEDNPYSLANNDIKDIYQDENGLLWVATSRGLNYIDFTDTRDKELRFHMYEFEADNPNSLIGNLINCIYKDDQGLLWFGTNRGISIYNKYINQFNIYKFSKKIEKTLETKNLYIDQEGQGWMSVPNLGLIHYDIKTKKITPLKGKGGQPLLADKKAHYLGSINDSTLCIGANEGIYLINKNQLTSKYYLISTTIKELGGIRYIRDIIKDKILGKIWIAAESGLYTLDESSGNYELYTYDPLDPTTIGDNACNDILESKTGELWIATYNGLSKVNLKEVKDKIIFERYNTNAKDATYRTFSNRLIALEEMGDNLYIGSTSGLQSYNYDTRTFVNHSANSNKFWVESLIKISDTQLWGSINEGLFYFDLTTKTFNVFEKKGGLGTVYFKQGNSYLDEQEILYFGSATKVISLHPNQILSNQKAPILAITDIKIISPEKESVLDGIYKKQIELDHNVYSVTINFAALNFNRPEKNQYAYRLEGFEEKWNYSTKSTTIYTNLNPGTYTFHVKAANNDGVWNETGKRLTIIKHPAFWQTTWFKMMNILGLLLLIGIGLKLYTRTINKRNRTLQTYNEKLNQEIRERKQVELALLKKETFTKLIMDNIPQHICWVDKQHRLIGANSTFLNALKIEKSSALIGQKLSHFYEHENNDHKFSVILNQVLEQEKPVFGKISTLKNGSSIAATPSWLKQDFIPLVDENNKTIGVLTSSTDITEQIKADEKLVANNKNLIRSNKELEQFAYIASHDLQTPLTTIMNFSKLLGKSLIGKMNKEEEQYMNFVINGTKNMQELIGAILAFSKINNQKLHIESFYPTKLIASIKLDLNAILTEKNATIQLISFPSQIQADRIKLKQLLQNLITNGIKFSRKNIDPLIIINCIDRPTHYEFQVKDNGIGISEQYTNKIFKLFHRLHSTSKYKGTGIGLALCKKLVEQQDGKIWVESTLNEGSTFFFTIKKRRVKIVETK